MVPVNKIVTLRLIQERFKLKDEDKLWVNLRHLVYYTLSWIAYIDNTYNIHRAPKDKYCKYLIRIYWLIEEKQFRDAKYIYR